MKSERIDLVHSHMYRSNVPATVAARLAGVPRVWCQVHNVDTWETSRQLAMDRRLMPWRTGIIGVSERVREDIVAKLRIAPERVRVIYNGVEIQRFEAARGLRGEVRLEHGVDPGDVVFLFAARLVEQKRAADFLTAIGRLQAEPGGERIRAWLLGDGPQRADLEAQAAALPRPNAVRFFGKLDDVERYMAAADVFVLPSTREGFSNALVEAMAAGLPPVATDVGGNAEAVRTGQDGLIVPPVLPDPLFRAMQHMADDAEFRRACAESAAARARDFTLDHMVRQVEELYEESCGDLD
jgi:glycosyltransferase involved in cell wall biosynthesis